LGVSTTSALMLGRRRVAPLGGSAALTDVAIAAVVVGSTIFMTRARFATSEPNTIRIDWPAIVLATLVGVPLVATRRRPMLVFVLAAGISVLMAGLGYPIGVPLAPAVALYFVSSTRVRAAPWSREMTAAAVGLLSAYLVVAGLAESTFPASEMFHATLLWSVAWFAGERTRLRSEQIAELKRDAQRERLLAAAEERTRIARDLHDSVGHAINVIGVRAGAARMRHAGDPERSLSALEAIEDLARRTVADIDHFVGALRTSALDHEGVNAPVGLASLSAVIAQHATSGFEVEYIEPRLAVPLPPVIDQAVFRIVQEALTNASRHGTGSARVSVEIDDRSVQLMITNPVGRTDSTSFRVGHGLIGMNERARLVGGVLDIDQPTGEYVVRAQLPLDAPT